MAELVNQIVEVTVAMFGEIGQRGQSAVGESRKTVLLNRATANVPSGSRPSADGCCSTISTTLDSLPSG
jgi:hypothetical protein